MGGSITHYNKWADFYDRTRFTVEKLCETSQQKVCLKASSWSKNSPYLMFFLFENHSDSNFASLFLHRIRYSKYGLHRQEDLLLWDLGQNLILVGSMFLFIVVRQNIK